MFKKIHEGLDLFNYYFTRHEASSNDSQREKLESDLKKEIKKLQKFRDQIKTWQGNDSLEATIAPQKLQEHRRLVEEAMECYKEVEKNSKMKSFSNQSIMLAALDTGEEDLTPEVEEVIEYLSGVMDELNEQNEKLEQEYEKISQKKIRKSNMLAIEERKQELEAYKNRNEFHIEKIEVVITYLKQGKLAADLVLMIQEDLNFYVESNQEPDFIDDDTLYDELFREAKEHNDLNTANGTFDESIDVSLSNGQDDTEVTSQPDIMDSIKRKSTASSSPAPQVSSSPVSKQPSVELPAKVTIAAVVTPKGKQTVLGRTETAESSPAFITTLKPASTPSKPVGALKWSLAAAGAAPTPESSNGSKQSSPDKIEQPKQDVKDPFEMKTPSHSTISEVQAISDESNASSELLSLLTKNDEYSPYLEVLKNSALTFSELAVFSDLNLLKTPPGIQDLVISSAANSVRGDSKLLAKPTKYSPYTSFLQKPYLPSGLQGIESVQASKPPLFLTKLQNYWNRIRASNQFNQFSREIELLEDQKSPENAPLINELSMVLFYGYYYGFLPLENIVAESLLHKLGWKPYGLREDSLAVNKANPRQFQYWFKQVGGASVTGDDILQPESGDFRVFDLAVWEIYVKYGFKFDFRLSRPFPSKSL